MHAVVSRTAPSLDSRAQLSLQRLVVSLEASYNSKRISDLLVGVEHDAEGAAHGTRRKVPLEGGTDNTALAVGGDNLAPDGLVLQAGLGVVLLVDVRDALAVVPSAGLAVLAALDVDEGSVVLLRPLASLETHENALGVKPMQEKDDELGGEHRLITLT